MHMGEVLFILPEAMAAGAGSPGAGHPGLRPPGTGTPETAYSGTGAFDRLILHETPYGKVEQRGPVLVRTAGTDPRALIYAAKAAGASAVLAAARVEPVIPLLEPGDLVVPVDVIDLTRLLPPTFFVGRGYGFIRLDPPFCPELSAALYATAREKTPRAFRGATYVGLDGSREATPAERRMYRAWGADVVGSGLVPEAFLARELELCYAALTVVREAQADVLAVLERAAQLAPVRRSCSCGRAMAGARAQGLIGEDWRQWLD
ncbi:MAG: hypothetical protein CWE10_15310 [Symbiobacterium thermophilum]|uniref:Nucleoside phosphorylase domain-containing protein n=2 Tax=Symbiobacterium thermophilum TaxID=2734 RepID=A0A953I5V6_SYMTR|nr:hypothetical protein [Symbiobacterium thermophilum]